MDVELVQSKIKRALKHVLKTQNHTYEDLAKLWECSLPTVKRQLGPEEMPVSRLLALLDWLNLSLSDLERLAESENLDHPRYTQKQNEFLAKNTREFSFLMKLYEGMSPDQIARKYKLSAQVLDKILIGLEKYDLIRVGAGGKVKPFFDKAPRLDGRLGQVHFRNFIDRISNFQKNHITEVLQLRDRGVEVPKGGLTWEVAEVSAEVYNEYLEQLNQLMSNFTSAAKIEKHKPKKSVTKTAILGVSTYFVENEDPNLPAIRDLFDDGLREEIPSPS